MSDVKGRHSCLCGASRQLPASVSSLYASSVRSTPVHPSGVVSSTVCVSVEAALPGARAMVKSEESSQQSPATPGSCSSGSVSGDPNKSSGGKDGSSSSQDGATGRSRDMVVGTAASSTQLPPTQDPVHTGGMNTLVPTQCLAMLLKADPGFEPGTGQQEAFVLAVVMLILLQREAREQLMPLGGPMIVQFTTESRAVVNGLAQLRAKRMTGEEEGEEDASPDCLDKLLRMILQLQDMWQSKHITTEVIRVPASYLAETVPKYNAVAAAQLARGAGRHSGMYAVLSNDSSIISVRCDSITSKVISLKLGEGPCKASQEAISLLQHLQNPEQLDLGGDMEGQEGGGGDGSASSSSSSDEEGGGGGGGGRPAKRVRID